MPNKCVQCGRVYDDESPEVFDGCVCGKKVFLFLKNGKGNGCSEDHDVVEQEIRCLVESNDDSGSVILDVKKSGAGNVNSQDSELIGKLKDNHALVYRLDDGKYLIDLDETFQRLGAEKKKKK
jgi:predicted  nucleic acid-binding Zn-ribbon protein